MNCLAAMNTRVSHAFSGKKRLIMAAGERVCKRVLYEANIVKYLLDDLFCKISIYKGLL